MKKRKKISVELSDGKVLFSNNVTDVFRNTIIAAGVERVMRLGIVHCNHNMISDYHEKTNYTDLGNGLYLCTYYNTECKYNTLCEINQRLGLGYHINLFIPA